MRKAPTVLVATLATVAVAVGCSGSPSAPATYTAPTSPGPYAVKPDAKSSTWMLWPVTVTHTTQDGIGRLTLSGLVDESVAEAINTRFAQAQDDYRAAHPGFEPTHLCVAQDCWVESGRASVYGQDMDPASTPQTTVYAFGNVISLYEGTRENKFLDSPEAVTDRGRFDSPRFDGSWFYDPRAESEVGTVLNVRLDTGEVFTLSDVFADDVSTEAILADVCQNSHSRPGDSTDDKVEAQVADVRKHAQKAKDPAFIVQYSGVVVWLDGPTVYLGFKDYWRSVAIAQRFSAGPSGDGALYTGAPAVSGVFDEFYT